MKEIIEFYGFEEKVCPCIYASYQVLSQVLQFIGITSDNASNNTKMMEELERDFARSGVFIDAKTARVRCIAHIVHLAALKEWIS